MRRASMENDHMMNNIVPLDIDRDAGASIESRSESALSNSLESGLTVQSSRGDADSKPAECSEWTNEKHNSYLDYLENSFVKQLYSLLGGETQVLSRSRVVQSNSHKSADQFTVLQNGCWQKVNFDKKRDHSEMSSESRIKKNSSRWSFKNSNGNRTTGREYAAQSTAEASGQNFREVEKGCNSEAPRKRRREAKCDESSLNDQVVP